MTEVKAGRRNVLDVLSGKAISPPPAWMMRQAGRYLPEYRAIRAQAGSFLDLCYNPKLATEVTLQPIRRFGFDAAILFSDILVIPHALGQNVDFVEGEGPKLDPIRDSSAFNRLRDASDEAVFKHLEPVFEALDRIRSSLPYEMTLLGFCGAPWTVASYMIGGRGTSDLRPARDLAASNPDILQRLIDRLVEVQTRYLIHQLRNGADAVQIFESHAAILPDGDDSFKRWCLNPIAKMISDVKAEVSDAKIIVFARGSGLTGHQRVVPETGADAVGVDWAVDLQKLRATLPLSQATQGNLNPEILIKGGSTLDAAVDAIREATAGKPHIFNLGHGITPQTPVTHVEQMLKRLRY